MKKSSLMAGAVAFMLIAGLGASCSKKEQTTSKKALPPGHEKMVEKMEKGMAESRKIVVARVNGATITMNDLVREMNLLGPRYLGQGQRPTPEIDARVRKEALDILIFHELALQDAERQGMKVNPEETDAAMTRLKTQLGSEGGYKKYLASRGLTEDDLRSMLGREHLFQMIASKEIFDKVKNAKPGEKEIRRAYDKEKSYYMLPERFITDDIFFKNGGNVTDRKQAADKVLAQLRSNKGDMSKLAPGGYVVRQLTVMQNIYPGIYGVLGTMKPGGVSGVIQERDGLHIVKLKRREPARQMTFKEAKNIIEQKMMRKAVEKRKEEWENQLKKNAKIEIISKGMEGIKPAY